MAKIRKVDYFVVQARNRAGEGARLLKALKQHDVGLLAFTAFPEGGGAQVDFVPEDTREFLAAAKALNWKVSPRKIGFVVHGKDKTGALAGLLAKLGKAGINVTALDAVSAGKRRFGAIFWVLPGDVARTAKLLDAR
jgi:hypothetical protein